MRYLALTAVLALALVGAASAAGKPTIVTEQVDETNIGVIDCGTVALDERVLGAVKVRSFMENGELRRELSTFRLKHTFTNPVTGASLTTPDVGTDRFTIHEDGSATLMVIGIVARVVVPGEGFVAGQIGQLRLVFAGPDDMDPDVILETGHQDPDEALDAALCEALA